MSISLVAGLGNPGREYEATRHNFGWVVLDAFAKKHGLTWKQVGQFEAEIARWDTPGRTRWLIKPQTFMNASGTAVGAFLGSSSTTDPASTRSPPRSAGSCPAAPSPRCYGRSSTRCA
jgi:peptidyl-tRNA hydrolase